MRGVRAFNDVDSHVDIMFLPLFHHVRPSLRFPPTMVGRRDARDKECRKGFHIPAVYRYDWQRKHSELGGAMSEEERETWIHPDAIRKGASTDRYDYYYRAWQPLYLTVESYQFDQWFSFQNADKYIDDDEETKTLLALVDEKGWDTLDKGQKETFRHRHECHTAAGRA